MIANIHGVCLSKGRVMIHTIVRLIVVFRGAIAEEMSDKGNVDSSDVGTFIMDVLAERRVNGLLLLRLTG